MAKTAKKEVSTGQVKYSDPRMAFTSTKTDMVLKECETLKIRDVFGNDMLGGGNAVMVCEDHIGLYLTSKENVGANYLDPYRNYRREQYELTKNDDNTFTIKANGNVYTV